MIKIEALETNAFLPAVPAVGKLATVYTLATNMPALVVNPNEPSKTIDIIYP